MIEPETPVAAPRSGGTVPHGALPGWMEPLAGRVYYGWVVLGAVSVTELVSWGILYYTFAVFVTPMAAELGWSPVALSGGFSIALLCSGLAAVPIGRWLDAHGPRALMTAGSLLASTVLVAWSRVETLWAFYLVMGSLGLAMAAVLYEPAFAIVTTWFRRDRGRALTVLTFFGALASTIWIPLANWLVTAVGWRQALVMLAATLAVITVPPHLLLLRRRPADLGLQPDGAPLAAESATSECGAERHVALHVAVRERSFWWLAFALAASTFAGVALTVHLIMYLRVQGHSAMFAATVAGLFGLMSLVGRLVLGPLGDRYARQRVTVGLLGLQLAGLALLALAPSAAGVLAAVALCGAGFGTLTIMRAALLAERYGAEHYGSINGTLSLVLTAAKTVAPVVAGAVAVWGGYRAMLGVLVGLLAAGMLALLQPSASR